MMEPFSLSYGDQVSVRIQGKDEYSTMKSAVGVSENAISPYISGQIEFGYHNFNYFPFD
jgi:hypothetical protein